MILILMVIIKHWQHFIPNEQHQADQYGDESYSTGSYGS